MRNVFRAVGCIMLLLVLSGSSCDILGPGDTVDVFVQAIETGGSVNPAHVFTLRTADGPVLGEQWTTADGMARAMPIKNGDDWVTVRVSYESEDGPMTVEHAYYVRRSDHLITFRVRINPF